METSWTITPSGVQCASCVALEMERTKVMSRVDEAVLLPRFESSKLQLRQDHPDNGDAHASAACGCRTGTLKGPPFGHEIAISDDDGSKYLRRLRGESLGEDELANLEKIFRELAHHFTKDDENIARDFLNQVSLKEAH